MERKHINHDDERSNKIFSFFLIVVGLAGLAGFLLGCFMTSLYLK